MEKIMRRNLHGQEIYREIHIKKKNIYIYKSTKFRSWRQIPYPFHYKDYGLRETKKIHI